MRVVYPSPSNVEPASGGNTSAGKRSHKLRNIVIAVGVVILILILPIASNIISVTTVNITAVNLTIDYTGSSAGYLGPSSRVLGNSFSVYGGDNFTDTLILTSGTFLSAHSINSIILSPSVFTLVSVSPNLPYNLTPSLNVTLALSIRAPNGNYNGSLGILLSTS